MLGGWPGRAGEVIGASGVAAAGGGEMAAGNFFSACIQGEGVQPEEVHAAIGVHPGGTPRFGNSQATSSRGCRCAKPANLKYRNGLSRMNASRFGIGSYGIALNFGARKMSRSLALLKVFAVEHGTAQRSLPPW